MATTSHYDDLLDELTTERTLRNAEFPALVDQDFKDRVARRTSKRPTTSRASRTALHNGLSSGVAGAGLDSFDE